MLEILDPYWRFYIKTDWSKDGMGVVLLQVDDSLEVINLDAQEEAGGKCGFEKYL